MQRSHASVGLTQVHPNKGCTYLLVLQRIKRAILTSFDVAKKDPTGKKITDKDREDIKGLFVLQHNVIFFLLTGTAVYTAYGHEAALARTFVDDVFGGVLVSTVKCNECNSVSLVCLIWKKTV